MRYIVGTVGALGLVLTIGALGGIENGGSFLIGAALTLIGTAMLVGSAFLASTMLPDEYR